MDLTPAGSPRFPGPLTLEGVEQIFEGCSDFAERTALLHNDPQRQVTLCYINGMVRGERINDLSAAAAGPGPAPVCGI